MTIPRRRSDALFQFAMIIFIVLSVLVAVAAPCVSLWLAAPYFWLGLAASLVWLALIGQNLWYSCKEAGGLRRYLIDIAADLCGWLFAEISTAPSQALELGVYLFGRRFVQQTIPLDNIESVGWNTGQATSMAGRDVNDWRVWIRFKRKGVVPYQEPYFPQNPEQDIRSFGSYGPKAKTEALGLAVVAFLRAAGVDMVDGPTPNNFVRRQAAERECEVTG